MRVDYNCRGSSQGIRGLSPTSSPPGPGFLHQEDELPKCLVLKARVAYFLETQGSVGNRDFTFKGRTHNLTHQDPGQKQWFEGSLGQTSLLTLKSLPERQEATGAHSGDIGTGSSRF